jgi:hypothetical protein
MVPVNMGACAVSVHPGRDQALTAQLNEAWVTISQLRALLDTVVADREAVAIQRDVALGTINRVQLELGAVSVERATLVQENKVLRRRLADICAIAQQANVAQPRERVVVVAGPLGQPVTVVKADQSAAEVVAQQQRASAYNAAVVAERHGRLPCA